MSRNATRITPDQLASLVGSRLCHDIISPLGAIGNGVELLQLSNAFPGIQNSPEMRLIAEAVDLARARLQAFRVAFGQSGDQQRMGRADLAKLLDGIEANGRLRLSLDANGDLPRSEARMILLSLMCIETALPWGGQVLICRSNDGWRLVAEADRTRPDAALWAWLNIDAPAPGATQPAQVQFPLLAELALASGRALHWDVDDTGAEISF